jgi:hypothetical protein
MRLFVRALCALALALTVLGGTVPTSAAAVWTGRYSVYTQGSFSMQHLNYTCVGASVQMMLNEIHGQRDHSASVQKKYWQYGRNHSRYLAGDKGVDPVGWVAALEHFGAGDYAISVSSHYQAALRTLAARMRAAHRPVGLFVHAGGHAWVMTGFEATADPARTSNYTVTAVQVMGPLYPYGTLDGKSYDPGPRTWLSAATLSAKFTRFRWSRAREWDGSWVAVVPK